MATRSALINVMHKAATAASRGMLRDFGEVENLQVSRKGPADFVSRADTNAERVIKSELQKARPDWGFIMEESGHVDGADPDAPVWIVDPLDGTTNFLHGIPHFAISIAVKDKGKITAALVFDPVRHEYFFAEAGQGAFVNDRRLRVSGRRHMADSLFATGIPFWDMVMRPDMPNLAKNFKRLWLSVLVSDGLDQPRLIWPMLPLAAMMDFGNAVSIHGILPQVSCWCAKLAVLCLILPRVIAPLIAAMLSPPIRQSTQNC